MLLKDVYTEIVKQVGIIMTIYFPIMMIQGKLLFTDWDVIFRVLWVILYLYMNVTLLDKEFNSKAYRKIKVNFGKLKQLVIKLRNWK